MKKQNETDTDSFMFQPNLRELQIAVNRIMDPLAQQARMLTLAKFGKNTLGSCYIETSPQEGKEKAVVIVMQVHQSRAILMGEFLRPFDDVVVQSSTEVPEEIKLAPSGTALLTLLCDRGVKLSSRINALGQALHLSKAALAVVMGVSERTIYNWTADKVKHPDKIKNITALIVIAMREPTMDTTPQGAES